MPCRDDRDTCGGTSAADQAYIDKLTRMLCDLCGRLEETLVIHTENQGDRKIGEHPTDFIYKNEELGKWWDNHKKVDEERRKAEEERKHKESVRKAALGRLTEYEKEVLGLNNKSPFG